MKRKSSSTGVSQPRRNTTVVWVIGSVFALAVIAIITDFPISGTWQAIQVFGKTEDACVGDCVPRGPVCGNNIMEKGEFCDGRDLGWATCKRVVAPLSVGGGMLFT